MKEIMTIKTIEILIYLSKNRKHRNMNSLSKEIPIPQTYLILKLKQLKEKELIYFEVNLKDRRLKIPRLTKKGVEISRLLDEIKEKLG